MSEQIDWSEAPADATHYQAATHGVFECWLKPGHAVRVSRGEPDWREDDYADDLIATSAIKRPWSGEGLPPVGVVCEMHYCGEWEKTEILCIGVKHVFIRQIAVTGEAFECSLNLSACQFRPIRTPEQIAADEREAAIKEMTANHAKNSDALAGWAAYVYDTLGYRKP